MAELNLNDRQVFYNVSTELGISKPQWLIDLVNFESGFNPKAKNPFSSARGLIQFIDSTARSMGYENSLDLVNKFPTIAGQMETPVKNYLQPYAPYTSEHQLYMAVFYPAARRYSADTTFKEIFQNLYPGNWESRYARFEKGNPGINTPQDYMNFVKKKPKIRLVTKSLSILTVVAIGYLLYKKFA